MHFVKKRSTVLMYLLNFLIICLMIPFSFLVLVSFFGAGINRDLIMYIFSLLFLAAFVIFCILVAMSILEVKNLVIHAIDKLKEEDYSTRIPVTDDMPIEIARILEGFNEMVKNTERLVKQAQEAVVEQKNAEIAALEAQIDPHFLYNTLDTINWKAIEHEDYEVSNMVGALADILRYTIKNPNAVCSIGQEIYWMEQYILFQKEKLGKDLEIIYDVPESLMGYEMHKLILQPFVENSIKHGFQKVDRPCVLEIKMRDAGEHIHITIQDNGIGMSEELMNRYNQFQEASEGRLGITNVCKRLRLYYGEDADLFFESEPDKYTRVNLFIPKRNRLNDAKESIN